MSDRQLNLHKPFIDYLFHRNEDECYIAVFDVGEPSSGSRDFNDWESYGLDKLSAKIKIVKGKVTLKDFDPNKILKIIDIARHYRPGIGRETGAVYSSIILSFFDKLKSVRFPNTDNVDDSVKTEIRNAFEARHPGGNPHITVNTEPRFIAIPYCVPIRTAPVSWINGGHFVTLIVDLDHRDYYENYRPFVYVYDSAHFLCKSYGVFSYNLNKDVYFKFGIGILVDDKPLNEDINYCPHFFCIDDNKTSKIQYVWKLSRPFDCRCGYYCEASINLLLKNLSFSDYNYKIPSGQQTRDFLRGILRNGQVLNEIEHNIIPPAPFEWFS